MVYGNVVCSRWKRSITICVGIRTWRKCTWCWPIYHRHETICWLWWEHMIWGLVMVRDIRTVNYLAWDCWSIRWSLIWDGLECCHCMGLHWGISHMPKWGGRCRGWWHRLRNWWSWKIMRLTWGVWLFLSLWFCWSCFPCQLLWPWTGLPRSKKATKSNLSS